jgi:hypothetical protein
MYEIENPLNPVDVAPAFIVKPATVAEACNAREPLVSTVR